MKNFEKKIVFRSYLFLAAAIIISFVVIGKILYLQLVTPTEEKEKISVMTRIIIPKRGNIYSSDGKLLATSVCYYDTYLDLGCQGVRSINDTQFDKEIDSLSICMENLFKNDKKTRDQYKKEIRQAKNEGKRCYVLKKHVSYIEYEEMKKFPFLRRGKYGAGFYSVESYKREKPFGKLARRTIGESDENNHFGLEYSFDSILVGTEGYAVFQKVSKDLWIPIENTSDYIKPVDGKDLITTIDIGLQDIVESELENQMREVRAEYGTVVLMEVKTGKIRAIANLQRDSSNNFTENYNYAVRNLPSGNASDPGSTFKIASVIVAIEDGYVTSDSTVDIEGQDEYYYGKRVHDEHALHRYPPTVKDIIIASSNVGSARLIYKYYQDNQQKFVDGLKRLHLTTPLGIELKGEASPIIHEPSEGSPNWSKISLPWMAYGYGVSVTPLQMLTLYNAIANNGKMMRPMFVEAIAENGKVIEQFSPYVIDYQICSKKTIDAVKDMLEGVVTDPHGTAYRVLNGKTSYSVAGKTGTAQMEYANGKNDKTHHASFIGYFPADNPKYSCVVSIYKPKGINIYGNVVSGTVFGRIAERIYSTDTKVVTQEIKTDVPGPMPSSKSGNRAHIQKVC